MARKSKSIRLTPRQKQKLKKIIRSRNGKASMAKRCRIILLSCEGIDNRAIADKVDLHYNLVAQWKKRWDEHGIEGLADRQRPGRPSETTAALQKKIARKACQSPPAYLGRWSVRTLADEMNVPQSTVQRVLQACDLKLHRLKSFTYSPDPEFEDKLLDVIGLYMNPPENAFVLCIDEKTGIQALDRTQPMLPLKAKKPRAWTNEYVRHGTRTLLACLDVNSGRVTAHVKKQRRSKDFLSFMDSVVALKRYKGKRLYIVMDNLNIHKNQAMQQWLQKHPNVSAHYTPTHASWLNMIEVFFSILTRQGLQHTVHKSARELEKFLKDYIREYNKRCGPFEWTKGPKQLKRIIQTTKEFQQKHCHS